MAKGIMQVFLISLLLKMAVLICTWTQAHGGGGTDVVVLQIQSDIKPRIVCRCGAERTGELKSVKLTHEITPVFEYVYFFEVAEGTGFCSCVICWTSPRGHTLQGDFDVYDSDIAKTYQSHHPYFMMLKTLKNMNKLSYVVWLVTTEGVHPAQHPQLVSPWNTKYDYLQYCRVQ